MGRVRARVRFRDDDGQLRPVEGTGSTRKAAERNLKEKLARRGTYSAGRGELSADTPFPWVEPIIGTTPLDKLRPSDITRLILRTEEAGKASSTRRNCYAALRGALDDAVNNGLLKENPATRVKRPRSSQNEGRALNPEEVAKFLATAQSLRYVLALKFILGTGLRRGEVLALRWDDLDPKRREAWVKGFACS